MIHYLDINRRNRDEHAAIHARDAWGLTGTGTLQP
jgi:hypothetical protein